MQRHTRPEGVIVVSREAESLPRGGKLIAVAGCCGVGSDSLACLRARFTLKARLQSGDTVAGRSTGRRDSTGTYSRDASAVLLAVVILHNAVHMSTEVVLVRPTHGLTKFWMAGFTPRADDERITLRACGHDISMTKSWQGAAQTRTPAGVRTGNSRQQGAASASKPRARLAVQWNRDRKTRPKSGIKLRKGDCNPEAEAAAAGSC
jgi:hypothetical protein